MKVLKLSFATLLFIALCILSYQTIATSKINQRFKMDYAEINHFQYGLFSVDVWKSKLSEIINHEIQTLTLTSENKDIIKHQIERQLNVLIDKMLAKIEKENMKSFKGKIKQTLMDSFVDKKTIKEGIPEYAAAMVKELTRARNQNEVKKILKEKISHYINHSFDVQDYTVKNHIVAKLGAKSDTEAKDIIDRNIRQLQDELGRLVTLITAASIGIFLILGLGRGPLPKLHYALLIGTLLLLLTTGVMTPMIDLEAKISHFGLVLLDHSIEFENQVLYFQTKSIIDVFLIMMRNADLKMKFVGILMVSFSIVFPILKLISATLYYTNLKGLRFNRLIHFLVHQTGKWSMADVLVVAIFMAYIGFNGVLDTQLKHLADAAQGLSIVNTNGTNLQPGYYLFLSYAILAMVFTSILSRRTKEFALSDQQTFPHEQSEEIDLQILPPEGNDRDQPPFHH